MATPGFQELFESHIKILFMYGSTCTCLQEQKLFHSPLATETYISSTHLRSKSLAGKS